MSIPEERLAQIAHRFAEIEARLASGQLEGEAFVAASRDYAELEPVAKAAAHVREMRAEIAELAALADEELAELRKALPEAERRLSIALLPRDEADARPAMLEIRAGTGGDEAALFAAEVWMRPPLSVTGTRCTRWTPLSNLSLAKTPLPDTLATISLKPPMSEAFSEIGSMRQPCSAA